MDELGGLRALVVEDEGIVALLIEDMLQELGCEIAASVGSLGAALKAAGAADFDFAVLDVNLNGELVFPVADILRRRRLPFVFSTGYGPTGLPEAFSDCLVLNKPFTTGELQHKLRLALGR